MSSAIAPDTLISEALPFSFSIKSIFLMEYHSNHSVSNWGEQFWKVCSRQIFINSLCLTKNEQFLILTVKNAKPQPGAVVPQATLCPPP